MIKITRVINEAIKEILEFSSLDDLIAYEDRKVGLTQKEKDDWIKDITGNHPNVSELNDDLSDMFKEQQEILQKEMKRKAAIEEFINEEISVTLPSGVKYIKITMKD